MTNITLSHFLAFGALLLTLISVGLAMKGQSITVRDNMDKFVEDLQNQGRWALWGTIAQALAIAFLVARAFFTGDV